MNRAVRSLCTPAAAAASLAALTAPATADANPFASRILAYEPAPGQFVRSPQYDNPQNALGPPIGGGTTAPDNTKLVSLGGFGGTITVGFDRRIFDNPHNPFGVDLIIFGNAIWSGGVSTSKYGEAGIVEVSRDDNGNGLPDDPWFLVPGSHLTPPLAPSTRTWDADIADQAHPPRNAAWVPPGREGVWTTSTYELPVAFTGIGGQPLLHHPEGPGATSEAHFGYADLSPTAVLGDLDGDNIADDPSLSPTEFYTRPDDPRAVGLTPGSGGGDGIDIADAVDPTTGARANLGWIDFVRITTAVDATHPLLGEISVEVGAVADARPDYTPDWNRSGEVSVQDIFDFLTAYFGASSDLEGGGADFNDSGATTVQDIFDFLAAYFSA